MQHDPISQKQHVYDNKVYFSKKKKSNKLYTTIEIIGAERQLPF